MHSPEFEYSEDLQTDLLYITPWDLRDASPHKWSSIWENAARDLLAAAQATIRDAEVMHPHWWQGLDALPAHIKIHTMLGTLQPWCESEWGSHEDTNGIDHVVLVVTKAESARKNVFFGMEI